MHQNSYYLFKEYALPYFRAGMQVLEVGPDKATEPLSLKHLVEECDLTYHFCSLENENEQWEGFVRMAGEYEILAPSDCYDIVFSANVIEHVAKPWRWLEELKRCLKPGGFLISVNPISWPYHPAPIDAWRLFPSAYQSLYEEVGLEGRFITMRSNPLRIEDRWLKEHGYGKVVDVISIAQKPDGRKAL